MCGIAGIANFTKSEHMDPLLCHMLGFLDHRGPDAKGIYSGSHVGLASARLSIIDIEDGDQPIRNEDGTIWVVFNGEIYNYRELRKNLLSKGHTFYTNSDTEVLVHLYEQYGIAFLNELNGQFAFALYDENKQSLLLGRDRVGIRPLFYHQRNGRMVFASEIKALFADSTIPRRINPDAMADIFTGWAPLCPLTPFEAVFQIPPGHFAWFSRDGLSIQAYWKLPFTPFHEQNEDIEDKKEELAELINDSVQLRMRADVPVGTYLSGGLDSTFITSVAKRFSNDQLCTFSISFEDQLFNEQSYQVKAIKALNTNHRNVLCTAKDIGVIFPKVIWHVEMPLLRTGPAPLYLLSRLVNQNQYKVVLSGEGADEVFAGYGIFKEDKVRRFCAQLPESKIRPRLFERIYPYIQSQNSTRSNAFFEQFMKKWLTPLDSPFYSHMVRWNNTSSIKGFFSPEFCQGMDGNGDFIERFTSSLPPDFMALDPLSRAQYTEITTFLYNYLLSAQGDRVAMAHSVEGRVPFLDHRLIEYACKLPPSHRLNGLKDKFILREIAGNHIHEALAQRPKQPYRAPIASCFVGNDAPDYVAELLSPSSIKRTGYFRTEAVDKFFKKCRSKVGNIQSEKENMALVGILSTQLLDELFVRNFPAKPVKEVNPVLVYQKGTRVIHAA